MNKDKKTDKNKFRVYIRPQSFSDCFIATMDPKDPLKICLYPSIKSLMDPEHGSLSVNYDDPEHLILYNYLMLKRDCLLDP